MIKTAGLHTGQAAGAWERLSRVEQMANVGSEVERAIRAHASGRMDRRDHAITRALDLFDLIARDRKWHGAPLRETRRVREEFCGIFFGDGTDPTIIPSLQKYFLQFAIAARQPRG